MIPGRSWLGLGLLLALLAPARAADPPRAANPADDFKLVIELRDAGKTPRGTAELVVYQGVGYQFLAENKAEVQIIDPRRAEVTLLHLKRKVQTVITWAQLDDWLERLRRAIARAAERRERSEARSDRLEAAMSRALIDPNFTARFDPEAHRLRLTNPTVEIDATGEPEPDAQRLARIGDCLVALAKLAALRSPTSLPPFARIAVIERLVNRHRLRPTELSFLYRLSGPPIRFRWDVRLVPELTERERTAIRLIERIRAETRTIPLDDYEHPARAPETAPGQRVEPPTREADSRGDRSDARGY